MSWLEEGLLLSCPFSLWSNGRQETSIWYPSCSIEGSTTIFSRIKVLSKCRPVFTISLKSSTRRKVSPVSNWWTCRISGWSCYLPCWPNRKICHSQGTKLFIEDLYKNDLYRPRKKEAECGDSREFPCLTLSQYHHTTGESSLITLARSATHVEIIIKICPFFRSPLDLTLPYSCYTQCLLCRSSSKNVYYTHYYRSLQILIYID